MAGQANVYDLTRADEPTQEGTPLNKASLLQDDTAALLALEQEDPTVNDALYALAIGGLTTGTTIITVLDAEGKPIPGVAINGLTDEGGNAVTTGQNGKATVICTAVTSVTFSSGCVDLVDVTQTITPKTPGVNLVTVTIPFEAAGTVKLITSSGAVKFYKARTVDLCLVGGGTGGKGGYGGNPEGYSDGGTGGSGGRVLIAEGVSVPKGDSVLAVGAGGNGGAGGGAAASGSTGAAGGNTTFLSLSSASGYGATAPFDPSGVGSKVGGAGGAGGGGSDGSTYGRGTAGTRGGGTGGNGGTAGGNGSRGSAGTNGGGGGGGGGGGSITERPYSYGNGGAGGKGGDGCLMVRIL